jgi:hypothetical protein
LANSKIFVQAQKGMSARFYIKDVYRLSQPEAFQSLDCVVAKAIVLIGLFGDQWLHFLDGDEELLSL